VTIVSCILPRAWMKGLSELAADEGALEALVLPLLKPKRLRMGSARPAAAP
jgi:hypothetical protein